MNSSQNQSGSTPKLASPAKAGSTFSTNRQAKLFNPATEVTSGSMNDSQMIRLVVTAAMKDCGLSRVLIAEEMSRLTGTTVTERQLNNFSADSREEYRFPCELERAFCAATGNYKLLTCRAELAGFRVIGDQDAELLELGRAYLKQKRAAAAMANLESSLAGVQL